MPPALSWFAPMIFVSPTSFSRTTPRYAAAAAATDDDDDDDKIQDSPPCS